jgi:hypothetical protein
MPRQGTSLARASLYLGWEIAYTIGFRADATLAEIHNEDDFKSKIRPRAEATLAKIHNEDDIYFLLTKESSKKAGSYEARRVTMRFPN